MMPTSLPSTSATQQREAGLSVSSKRNERSGHGKLNDTRSIAMTCSISSNIILRMIIFMWVTARLYANRSAPGWLHHPLHQLASASMPVLPVQPGAAPTALVRQDEHFYFLPVYDGLPMSTHHIQWKDS